MDNVIFDPVNEYATKLKHLQENNAIKHFDQLVKQANLDLSANKKTVDKIKKNDKVIANEKNKIRNWNILKFILILSASIAGFVLAISIYSVISSSWTNLSIGLTIGMIIILVVSLVLLWKFVSPKIKMINKNLSIVQEKTNKLINQGWAQMQNLNELFDWDTTIKIANLTTPIVKLDEYLDNQKLALLMDKYGLQEKAANISTMFVQSGSIVGNPFLICKNLEFEMGTERYQGSITISWTESYTDKDGKRHTRIRTQVLTASVTKPCPKYYEKQFLVYGNEAVSGLSYTRLPSGVKGMDEKNLEKFIRSQEKRLDKQAQKAIKNNTSFNLMNNTEFEALFGAQDRNDEVQFRTLFSPLAQTQMINLIKDQTKGYGDDFVIAKMRNLNIVTAKHFEDYDFNIGPKTFAGYDFETIKANFLKINDDYFKHIFFALAPILATPLYQQHKPFEYIYPDKHPYNPSQWELESIANFHDIKMMAHPESITENILKAEVVKETKQYKQVKIIAHGFKGVERITYKRALGGDGRMHTVPVHWTEFFPVVKDSNLFAQPVNDLKTKEYQQNLSGNAKWQNFFKKNELEDDKMLYRKNIISFFSDQAISAEELKVFNIKNKKTKI